MCNNNCFNGCGNNRFNGGEFENFNNWGCGCGCNNWNNWNNWNNDAAFCEAARVNQRILARRACEDRAAAHFLRNLQNCRRCW